MKDRFKITFLTAMMLFLACKVDDKMEIERIDIFYMGWNIMTFKAVSCDDLINSQGEKKISLTDRAKIGEFLDGFGKIELGQPREFDHIDVRICCAFYDRDGSILKRISFSKAGFMQIDREIYKTDREFFEYIVNRYLPEDYLEPDREKRSSD